MRTGQLGASTMLGVEIALRVGMVLLGVLALIVALAEHHWDLVVTWSLYTVCAVFLWRYTVTKSRHRGD